MFEITITGTDRLNPYEELIRVFLQPRQYRLSNEPSGHSAGEEAGQSRRLSYRFDGDSDRLKREIYNDLSACTGKAPKWGILTGIRPVKLAYELAFGAKSGKEQDLPEDQAVRRAEGVLREKYLLHPDKAALAGEILRYQRERAGDPPRKSLSVYLGIPFCPTRCLYCSFTSNQVGDEEIKRYLQALHKEIAYAGQAASEKGYGIESFYIGGGTPTTLTAGQLDRLLSDLRESFMPKGRPLPAEFTVEAGRPDTITEEKLAVLREHGVSRISINPQSMKQATLDLIGRKHTTKQTEEAFEMAVRAGFDCINTDLIAGLPGEDYPDFAESLKGVLRLGADNVTIHTLAVKRASRLKEIDENFNYKQEELREIMLSHASEELRKKGFRPYYLYRQKHTSGNTENIGYCREDKISLYNIRIMEERQGILALGAGGISKVWFPAENRLERVANVSNYEIYIDRIEEMIERKRSKYFELEE